ncbi:tryptophan-rich sensory protein [Arthrobacter sp. PvP102]|jgi:tryptophan-rich sensory protein|uniref:TspO/MBR family protein n=1 Tax=unclassified Arthrobacter TaxID=235627 RepID=UPI001AE46D49|nr:MULTISPECIES: TspO/MBR family protein [unclassified Arthrobacter]MBP1235446.1 tryptophan-rich sensory protein [Arthrobacter sp. PvP103]MBP1236405.1 tryptophan-rich sensory protein [Arthrobacter sp. PvP102]
MKLLTVAWTAAASAATAAAGAVATDPDSRWYQRLRKPDWQPPAIAFPVVWTALYADLAVSSAVALDSKDAPDPEGGQDGRREIRAYRGALAANLVLNATWSWVFWRARRPWLAAAEAAVLAASSADLVRRTYKLNSSAGVALAPYALWCGFATALSTAVARLNPGAGGRR